MTNSASTTWDVMSHSRVSKVRRNWPRICSFTEAVRRQRWTCVLALILFLPVSLAWAQTKKPAGFGLQYSPQQMAERLMDLAEGPPPKREDIEHEFGFKFVLFSHDPLRSTNYRAYANAPFAPQPSEYPSTANPYSNIWSEEMIRRDQHRVSFNFSFWWTGWLARENKVWVREYCVPLAVIVKRLSNRWTRVQRGDGLPHGVPIGYVYQATLHDLNRGISIYREITVSPTEPTTSKCLEYISAHFSVVPLAGDKK